MKFVIERIGRENYEENDDEIIDNFAYEFFEEEKKINKEINNKIKKEKDKKIIKEIDNDMVIDFDEENNEKEKSNKNNYSLDQEDIIEILNLNKDNDENNSEKKLLDKLNAKILLKDLYEKKKQMKNAYEEYSSKLIETMKNNYVKNILENSSNKKNKINNDFLIHQQTNTINDINIFCLNNNKDNNNIINFNNFEYKNNIINNKEFKDFLIEYNNSILNRTFLDMKKNPNLNYELFIDILNDLNYIDITKTPQIYFLNNSLYKNLWNFLISTLHSKNDNNHLESNTLLIFLLILNGFFNSVKKLIEIKSELNWLNLENYEILIINDKYITKNFSELNEIRAKHKKNIIKENPINNINIINKKIKSVEISGCHDDVISDYLNSYDFNTISKQTSSNQKLKIRNLSETKLNKRKNVINKKEHKTQHIIYAFKPKIRNISFNAKKIEFNNRKNQNKNQIKKNNNNINVNKLFSSNSSISNFDLKHSLNKSGRKSKNKTKINYIEFVNLSQNDINKKNSKSFFKYDKNYKRNDNSNSKIKKRNYYNKIQQNRTDLLKLFKNNKYKDGTIDEKYEEIKRKRENNSKSKGKIKINYENVIRIDKFEKLDKDKNNEVINQKHKFHFRKKEYN